MIAFYLSDIFGAGFETPGFLPLADKASWGNEDIALALAFEDSGLESHRVCTPELWHIYHGKTKWWDSYDGMHSRKPWEAQRDVVRTGPVDYATTRDWVVPLNPPDGAEYLYSKHADKDVRCKSRPKSRKEVLEAQRARKGSPSPTTA